MIKEISLISCKEILMSAKSESQQNQELQCLELPGTLNSWEEKLDRYTNTQLGESAGVDFTGQIQSSLIRRDKNRLDGVQNRCTLVVKTTEASTYEELVAAISIPQNNKGAKKTEIVKVHTRNAESKTYFVSSPWSYDDSGIGRYKRAVTETIHTYAIEGFNDTERPALGDFYQQIYEDGTQEKAILTKKVKSGFTNFPQTVSSKGVYTNKDNPLSIDLEIGNQRQNTSKLPSTSYKEGTLVEAVKNGDWSPKYVPVAMMASLKGNAKPPRCVVGKDKKKYEGADTVKQDFGPRIRPNTGEKQFHKGQDMGGNETIGYPIVSVEEGYVESITPTSGQPRSTNICIITIRHALPVALENEGYEVRSRYMHLFQIASNPVGDKSRLQVGDSIAAGQILGFMGGERGWPGSGNTTGAHLHFEICIRRKLNGGGYKYDTYTAEELAPDGSFKSVSVVDSGKGHGKFGAVDPLHFEYKKLKTFSREKANELKDNWPKTIQEREDAKRAAAIKNSRVGVLDAAVDTGTAGPKS